jgi:hypothetical protein
VRIVRRIWFIGNTALVVLALWGGYRLTAPEALRRANPDPILCGILLVIVPFFALGTVHYSKYHWNQANQILARPFKLRRPSWGRSPTNWWGDPLQSLFISTRYMAGMAVGAAVRRPAIGSVGFWMLGTFCSVATGLAIGQLLVHRVYRPYLIGAKP